MMLLPQDIQDRRPSSKKKAESSNPLICPEVVQDIPVEGSAFFSCSIRDIRVEVGNPIFTLSTPKLLQLAGMLNFYAYCIVRHYAAADKVDGRLVIDNAKFENLMGLSTAGELTITGSVLYLSNYLQTHWQGAYFSPRSIRRCREFMRDELRLFDFIPQVGGRG